MNIDFSKHPDSLVPVIVQDDRTLRALMLGYMNREAYEKTASTGRVTFFSRTKKRLWIKGETSGNFLTVNEILKDCDSDTLLIKADPAGPVCHSGADTCFDEKNEGLDLLFDLERLINERKANPIDGSYTSSLFAAGLNRVVQKVGEEAIELVIEAKGDDDAALNEEAADLLFHFLVLLAYKGIGLRDVYETLRARKK